MRAAPTERRIIIDFFLLVLFFYMVRIFGRIGRLALARARSGVQRQ